MKNAVLPLFLLFGLILSSCDDYHGVEEIELNLETNPFDEIRLYTSSDIRIIQSSEYRVIITGEANDVNDIQVRVVSGRLTIEEHNTRDEDLLIKIHVPDISQLQSFGSSFVYGESHFQQTRDLEILVEGSGDVDFAISTDDVEVEISGSGSVILEGITETLDARISGSGWIRSFNLESELADVLIEGSGSAEVYVIRDLDAFISGSGNIYYKGHPIIHANIIGSGSVIDAN